MNINRRTFFQVATGTALRCDIAAEPWRRPIPRGRCAWWWRSCRAAPPTRWRGRFPTISSRRSGEPVVIENRPGAGGYIAWTHVASSEPDGHTLLLAENALGMSQALYRKSKSSFDPLKQYDPVAGLRPRRRR